MASLPSDEELEKIAGDLAHALEGSRLTLVTAESCTGGWVGRALTSIAGSSRWFDRGFITYSNTAKTEMLGVPAETLERQGAVSEATVRAMAAGALARSPADIAVAVTGVAGPGGGSPDKPVGTVWFAWGRKGPAIRAECFQLDGDRDAVRRQSVAIALKGLLKLAQPESHTGKR